MRFSATIVAAAVLFGAYVALQVLQAILTHYNGKPDVNLIQVLALLGPILLGALGAVAATAHTKADNADFRSQRTERTMNEIHDGTAQQIEERSTPDATPPEAPGSGATT